MNIVFERYHNPLSSLFRWIPKTQIVRIATMQYAWLEEKKKVLTAVNAWKHDYAPWGQATNDSLYPWLRSSAVLITSL